MGLSLPALLTTGQALSAKWCRDVVAAIRAATPIWGQGFKATPTPNGTSVAVDADWVRQVSRRPADGREAVAQTVVTGVAAGSTTLTVSTVKGVLVGRIPNTAATSTFTVMDIHDFLGWRYNKSYHRVEVHTQTVKVVVFAAPTDNGWVAVTDADGGVTDPHSGEHV